MRILVTGGTGYLGSAIVRAIVRRGHDAIVFARHARASALPGTLVDGDIRDRDALNVAARSADAMCHTAALVSVWSARRKDFDEINVGGLRNAIDVCAARHIRRFVYTSSFLALPPAGRTAPLAANDYQRTKAAAHVVARDAVSRGLPLICLFPGVLFGPGPLTESNQVGRLIRDHLDRRLPGIVGADRTWSFAWVEDVADAHVSALERGCPGAAYLLGGENCPQIRLFEVVREVTGRRLPRRIPFPIATAAAAVDEARARLRGQAPFATRRDIDVLRHDWPLNSARSIEELGYRITTVDAGVRAILAAT